MAQEFCTSVGRIVWGNPAKATVKKHQNGADKGKPVVKDGKNVEQWAFGIAFPKHEFDQFVRPYLDREALSAFPHGTPQGFSWKFKDGDGVDRAGKPYNTREGYAGHYVLTVSTEAFAPQIWKNEGGRYRQLEPHEIKCGDYAVVNLTVKVNVPTNNTHTAGLYVNPNGIELVGYGSEIVTSGADPDEMFAGRTYALPAGASAVPMAPTANTMPPQGYQQAPQQPAPQGYAPQPAPVQQPVQYQPQPVQQAPVQYYQPQPAPVQQPVQYQQQPAPQGYVAPPATDFVQNAGQQPVQYQQQPAPQGYAPAPR